MATSSSTDDGFPVQCDVCGKSSLVNISRPPGDSVCTAGGSLLWVNALVEVTSRHSIVPDVRVSQVFAKTRDEVIHRIIHEMAMELNWAEDQAKEFTSAILKREDLGSTAIGRGIAIPHASLEWLERCTIALAFVPDGVDF